MPSNTGRIFNDAWKIWIWQNLGRGCSKDSVFKELVERGFTWQAVRAELGYEPQVPLEQISSPQVVEETEYQPSPLAQRIGSNDLELYSVKAFLGEDECKSLVNQIVPRLQASTTVDEARTKEVRTSRTCFFDPKNEQHSLAGEVSNCK